jgi:pimeloyl-ACP methyl ester esterase
MGARDHECPALAFRMPVLERDHPPALHHEAQGDGPPVLLLHGWSRSSADFAPLAARLSVRHRVIRPDLRGHGRSAPGRFTLDDLAWDVTALAAALDVREATLVGWSLGAQVALAAWPSLAGRVDRLVLIGATPRFTEGDDWPHGMPARAVEGLALRLRRQPERTLDRFFADCFAPDELDDAGRTRISALARAPAPELACALAGLGLLITTDLRTSLPALTPPTLLLHGDADAICPPGAARAMAALLPRARLELLVGAGHAPFLSREAEVASRIAAFAREGT